MTTVQTALWVVVMLVMLALVFDFMNGFHDAANSIATVVSTGVLRPGQAVVFAAFFNFIAIFVFHLSVAATVGKGIADPSVVDPHVVFGALTGASTWNRMPSSMSRMRSIATSRPMPRWASACRMASTAARLVCALACAPASRPASTLHPSFFAVNLPTGADGGCRASEVPSGIAALRMLRFTSW